MCTACTLSYEFLYTLYHTFSVANLPCDVADVLPTYHSSLQTLYQVHLSHEKRDCTMFMSDVTRVLLAGCDCVSIDTLRLKMALVPGQETSDISILLKDIETQNGDVKKAARTVSSSVANARVLAEQSLHRLHLKNCPL